VPIRIKQLILMLILLDFPLKPQPAAFSSILARGMLVRCNTFR